MASQRRLGPLPAGLHAASVAVSCSDVTRPSLCRARRRLSSARRCGYSDGVTLVMASDGSVVGAAGVLVKCGKRLDDAAWSLVHDYFALRGRLLWPISPKAGLELPQRDPCRIAGCPWRMARLTHGQPDRAARAKPGRDVNLGNHFYRWGILVIPVAMNCRAAFPVLTLGEHALSARWPSASTRGAIPEAISSTKPSLWRSSEGRG
jgi:hypothetical protein